MEPQDRDADWERRGLKKWAWGTATALVGFLTSLLVWVWISNADRQVTQHSARLDAANLLLYQQDTRLAVMESENKQLRKDHERMEERLQALCRAAPRVC